MRRWLVRFAAIAMLVGLPPTVKPESAAACACEAPGSPSEEMEKHDAVLLGQVASVYQVGTGQRRDLVFEMEVYRWWKGDLYETVYLIGGRVTGDCRWYEPSNEYRPNRVYAGKTYIVYADRVGSRGFDSDLPHDTLIPDGCSRTEEVADLQDPHGLGVGQAPLSGAAAPRPAGGEEGFRYPLSAWATGVLAFVVLAVAGAGFLIVQSWRHTTL
ncbi:MAG: hypothetical protein F4Y97_06430 [Dehalococcoidia bacterium]|nr:hypothetical protein [Dehalococcoidia bacterium]